MQMACFSILASRKIMTENTNPLWMPATLQSPKIMVNDLGVPPQAPHIFHVHLCTTSPAVCQNPCDTTHPMLPCGERAILLSAHATYLLHCKNYIPHHLEASHAQPLKPFSAPSHFSHFGPGIHCVKFDVALQSMILSWLPFGCKTGL